MSQKTPNKITGTNAGFFGEIGLRIKLILRLMGDRRINPFYKIIPIATIVYFIVPDLVPGPIDDALIIWLGSYLFVELCPPEIVEEHMRALRHVVPINWQDSSPTPEDVIEGEFTEAPGVDSVSEPGAKKAD